MLIEELVSWETKIKDISWIICSPKAELYAKQCYKKLGKRPPNGVPGSASTKSLKLEIRMQYSALAAEYQNAINNGNNRNQAMLSVFRVYWELNNSSSKTNKIKSSVWISTTKNIDCGIEELVTCYKCSGRYLLDSNVLQTLNDKCIWCNHTLPIHLFRK
jgi:Flagellar transcriptional activator (FlhC)